MKKTLFLSMAISLMLLSYQGKAQLPDGSYAPNFIMQDISGTTQNLYNYLDAGKPVIMDVSAVWCGPCWTYHQTKALETYYNAYGPPGNNTSQVLWIEGDQSQLSCLQGSGCSTQGNWTTGVTFPMMLTASPNNNQVINDYKINSFPTVFKICPDRTVFEVGAVGATTLHNAALACPSLTTTTNDVKVFSLDPLLGLCGSISPKITLQNYGNNNLTSCVVETKIDGNVVNSYNWTGNLARYEIEKLSISTISGITIGSHTISFALSNPNGVADDNSANNNIAKTFTGNMDFVSLPIIEEFSNTGFPPSNWTVFNVNEDAVKWIRSGSITGNSGSPTNAAKLDFYESPDGNIDELYIAPVDFSSAVSATMTFYVAYARFNSSYWDQLQVQVSVNCGTTWVTVYDKKSSVLATASDNQNLFSPTSASQWRKETISLNNYAGKSKVFIKFKGISGYGNDLYIDDINITKTVGVKNIAGANNNVTVFPNPFSNSANVSFTLTKPEKVSFDIYNLLGEKVVSLDKTEYTAGTHSAVINSDNLSQGVYYLKAIIGEQKYTQKLTVVK